MTNDPSSNDPSTENTASTTPASTTPASTTPASTTPASTTPASTTPASTTPASTTPASTTPASTTPALTTPACQDCKSRKRYEFWFALLGVILAFLGIALTFGLAMFTYYAGESDASRERIKYYGEQRDIARGELSTLLAEAMRQRGAALLVVNALDFARQDDGKELYTQAYVWMGHRMQNELQVQRALSLIKSIENLEFEMREEKKKSDQQLKSVAEPSVSISDRFMLAALMIQNGHYRSGRDQIAEVRKLLAGSKDYFHKSLEMEINVLEATALYLNGERKVAVEKFDSLVTQPLAWANERDDVMYRSVITAVWCELELSEMIQYNRQAKGNEKSLSRDAAEKPAKLLRDMFVKVSALPDSVFTNIYGVNKTIVASMIVRSDMLFAESLLSEAASLRAAGDPASPQDSNATDKSNDFFTKLASSAKYVEHAKSIIRSHLQANEGLSLSADKLYGDIYGLAAEADAARALKELILVRDELRSIVDARLSVLTFESPEKDYWRKVQKQVEDTTPHSQE